MKGYLEDQTGARERGSVVVQVQDLYPEGSRGLLGGMSVVDGGHREPVDGLLFVIQHHLGADDAGGGLDAEDAVAVGIAALADGVGDGRVLAVIDIDGLDANHLRAGALLLAHANHVLLRVDDFRRIVVHVQHADLQGNSRTPAGCALIPRLNHQVVHFVQFTVQWHLCCDVACKLEIYFRIARRSCCE